MLTKFQNVFPSVNGIKVGYDPFFTGYSGFCFHNGGIPVINDLVPVPMSLIYYDTSYLKNMNNGTTASIKSTGQAMQIPINQFDTDWQLIWSEEDIERTRNGISESRWNNSADFNYHFWAIDKIYSIDCFHMTKFPSYFYNITEFPSASENIFRSESISSIGHIDGEDSFSSHLTGYTNNIIPSITAVSAACPNLRVINGPFAHFTAAADYNEAKELYPEWTNPW